METGEHEKRVRAAAARDPCANGFRFGDKPLYGPRRFGNDASEPVAQPVEHLTFNQRVSGSNPDGLTNHLADQLPLGPAASPSGLGGGGVRLAEVLPDGLGDLTRAAFDRVLANPGRDLSEM